MTKKRIFVVQRKNVLVAISLLENKVFETEIPRVVAILGADVECVEEPYSGFSCVLLRELSPLVYWKLRSLKQRYRELLLFLVLM
jgi:hypothetical protein